MTDALLKAKDLMLEEQRRNNRAQMPNLAALVDEVREVFPDAKLIWGEDLETGKSVGKKPDDSNVFVVPPNYYPTMKPETTKRKANR
jgi:hypothetical protein